MKAITLYQPWASLIAIGAKKFETRSWATSYRGPIAIHAGKKIIPPHEIPKVWRGVLDVMGNKDITKTIENCKKQIAYYENKLRLKKADYKEDLRINYELLGLPRKEGRGWHL